jgi:hypothetical protein
MSGGGAAAQAEEPVEASSSYSDAISSNDHLFFDDDEKYISQVNTAVAAYNESLKESRKESRKDSHKDSPILLQSIHCPTGQVELVVSSSEDSSSKPSTIFVKGTGEDETKPGENYYSTVKLAEIERVPIERVPIEGGMESFKTRLSNAEKTTTGNGITLDMIQKIITYEKSSPSEQPKIRKYFFDLDLTLFLVTGLSFDNTDRSINTALAEIYAKYLFSNYTGEEPPGVGRFGKLKEMFTRIGADRVYVITSNGLAGKQGFKKNGTRGDNPYRKHVLELLRELHPDFIEEHLICSHSTNTPHQNNKGNIIVDILDEQPLSRFTYGGMRRTIHRKPKRKSSSSRSRYKRRRYSKKSKK